MQNYQTNVIFNIIRNLFDMAFYLQVPKEVFIKSTEYSSALDVGYKPRATWYYIGKHSPTKQILFTVYPGRPNEESVMKFSICTKKVVCVCINIDSKQAYWWFYGSGLCRVAAESLNSSTAKTS